ncbi:sacsin N-terminal ATP-binding-like domain-containing protein [Marinobacter sp. Arc7-DN-1]|uniref:sacsin N-terminal ATP-binding-like domain-containing protein n=1 Tax=Marinobacter sp. Arc7-DN-1 TaxID=2304594 RepID=UPI000E44251A|nr:hypothetical protein [Marinobacter sp. Arc7-DN-1]AXS81905.1 hypothetical protein D0851_01915 [Marinobacter sp. Arc7-DN-1]
MLVKAIVGEMVREKCKLYQQHPDTVAGHIAHERAVTNDYRGRVLYELLQNAVDRAEANIWIIVDPVSRSLTVANDGKPFGARARQNEPRSDLKALCSIDTTNKKPGEAIGNKGVGFKSIWEFCNSVSVRTKGDSDTGNWGIRLRWPLETKHLEQWEDIDSANLIGETLESSTVEEKFRGQAPSFYFPEFISNPAWKEQGAVTAIELEDIAAEAFDELLSGPLQELESAPLDFVCDIRTDGAPLNLRVRSGSKEVNKQLYTSADNWIRVDVDTAIHSKELKDAMGSLGFELDRQPRLVLGFPVPAEIREMATGKFHGYLPTEVETGSPLHIQGDFYLSESRKQIDFQNNRYNRLLLDTAVESLFSNILSDERVAELPYIFEMLCGKGVLAEAISKRLTANGALLSKLIGSAISSPVVRHKSYFDQLYRLIGTYLPAKGRYQRGENHDLLSVDPYLACFSKEGLKIVPTRFDSESYPDDPVVTGTCSLPRPAAKNSNVTLFCRGRVSSNLKGDSIDLPGIVVTDWNFPGSLNVANTFKRRGLWADYDATSILRAIRRAQFNTSCDAEKRLFLAAARDVYSPDPSEGSLAHTHWRFLGRDEVFPSQRLQVPVLPSGSWAPVNESFMTSYIPSLSNHLDLERVSEIDEKACEEILGPKYPDILKYWGVWDVVPLVSKGAVGQWEVPVILRNKVSESNALKLLAKSYGVWMSSDYQRTGVKKALEDLAKERWLEVSSGSVDFIEPFKAYLGVTQGKVQGFPVLEIDSVSLLEKTFLDDLGVRSVDQTGDLEKLIATLEDIAHGCSDGTPISGGIRSVYRQLVKQINRVLVTSGHQTPPDLLDRIPLFFEKSKSLRRGIAGPSDRVWYIPEALRKTRSKIGDGDHYLWLANGDLGTLANKLNQVQQVSLKSPITVGSDFVDSEPLRHLFETDYLPSFLSLACYGDLPGLAEVDESTIQKRWQALVVLQGEHAQQNEKLGTEEVELRATSVSLLQAQLLWEPLRSDSKRNLIVYVSSSADRSSREFRYRVCEWFAEEVFRRPQLAFHFKQMMDSPESPESFELPANAVQDARTLINQWFPDSKVEHLISELSEVTDVKLTKANWRDQTLLKDCGVRFDQIREKLSGEFAAHLDPLNPEHANQARLLEFVSHHQSHLDATKTFSDFDEAKWASLLGKDPVRYRYDFDPLRWILSALEVTEEEFNDLKGRLDGELRKSEREADEMGLKAQIDMISELKPTKITQSEQSQRYTGRIFEVSSEEQRTNDQINKARSGKLAEKLNSIHAAKRAAALELQDQKILLERVAEEYARISEANPKLLKDVRFPELPCTEEQWRTILHLADRWDGLGYDYLDFDQHNGQLRLLLVEMKSSRQEEPCIYLSENERLCVLKYSDTDFMTAYPGVAWRLLLQTGDKMIDATEFVIELVRKHAIAFNRVPSGMSSEGWIIRVARLQ